MGKKMSPSKQVPHKQHQEGKEETIYSFQLSHEMLI
jgi:hypothetical protein